MREVLPRARVSATLRPLAGEVAVSPFHLARGFRQAVRLPIHRYLSHLRLRVALARLTGVGGDLLTVALDCGFSSRAIHGRLPRPARGAALAFPAGSLPRELQEKRRSWKRTSPA